MLIGISVAVIYAVFSSMDPKAFPISHIIINEEVKNVSSAMIEDAIKDELNVGFFKIELDRVSQKILSLPWVNQVKVKKIWPSSIKITIVEQIAVARWSEQFIIDQDGKLFSPIVLSDKQLLPLFLGGKKDIKKMISIYGLLDKSIEKMGVSITSLMFKNNLWSLVLSNDINVILGKKDIAFRFKRFSELFKNQLNKQERKIDQIDLRYSNGFAVKWKQAQQMMYLEGNV
ncbi:MAG: FtsQ-type POTRA domain-containing protein [Methylococcales bacterium]|nr:FtsQ-type POTRA domain-containing protein [Methylococcales bacterium]